MTLPWRARMVTAPGSSLRATVCSMRACRRSSRSEEKPTDSGLTTVMSTVAGLPVGAGCDRCAVIAVDETSNKATPAAKPVIRRKRELMVISPEFARTLAELHLEWEVPGCAERATMERCEAAGLPDLAR